MILKKIYMNSRFVCLNLLLLLIWNYLVASRLPSFGLTLLIGVYLSLFLPGLLIMMSLGAKRLTLLTALNAFGLSIAFNIIVGLIANFVPQLFGNKRPLNTFSVLLTFNILFFLLCICAKIRIKNFRSFLVPIPNFDFRNSIIYIFSIIGLLCCIFGTFRLNNGADNYLSVAGIILLIANCTLVMFWRKKLSTLAFVCSLAGLTAGLMLITSLRSNFISGQDLKQEFRVFTLTNQFARWSNANLADAYNACLSITLLPYVLSKLFVVSGTVIFKVIFPFLFIICPLAIFTHLCSKFNRNLAYIGALSFLAVPTVGLDLPLQSRQQIAFIFLSLAILAWFSHKESWSIVKWQLLFIIFSFSLIVSHYSSSYVYIGMILIYLFLRFGFYLLERSRRLSYITYFSLSGKVITIVVLFAFMWLTQATSTSEDLVTKISKSLKTLTQDKSGIEQTSDQKSLIAGGKHSITSYIERTSPHGFNAVEKAQSAIIVEDDTLKPAPIVNKLPPKISSTLTFFSKKMYYLVGLAVLIMGILIGIFLLVIRGNRILGNQKMEYAVICFSLVLILGVQAILPGITQDYGITRLFIQAFIIFCVPFTLCLKYLIDINPRIFSKMIGGVIILLLCTYSGLLTQLFGGARPQLNLNNTGPYYGSFYTHRSDIYAFAWVQHNIPDEGNVNSPDYSLPTALAYDPSYDHYAGGIFPFQNIPNNYILLNYSQTHKGVTYVSGALQAAKLDVKKFEPLIMIYTNGGSSLYK